MCVVSCHILNGCVVLCCVVLCCVASYLSMQDRPSSIAVGVGEVGEVVGVGITTPTATVTATASSGVGVGASTCTSTSTSTSGGCVEVSEVFSVSCHMQEGGIN